MNSLTGQSIGRYHILEQLGEGGMATVYKAYDTRLEREVAVKVLRTDQFIPAQLQMVLQRFEREAKSLAKLSHPNIVNILDYGEHEGMPYLIMEYLPGGTLKQKLGQALPWKEAVRLLIPVAKGLAYAHGHGVIHRDVKPANVLLKESGTPVLTDFGIAKLLEAGEGHTLTGSGVGIGTPEYMAPEQGIGAKVADARVDIYSLGIVLYEMVTGRKPYVADTPMAVVIKQISDPLPRPTNFVPELPADVEYLLLKALAKQPEDRYPDMNAMIAAMEDLLAEVPTTPVAVSPAPMAAAPTRQAEKKAWARPRLSPRMLVFIGVVIAFMLLAVFGLPWVKQQFSAASIAEATSTAVLGVPSSTSTLSPPTPTLELHPSPTPTGTPQPTSTNTPIPAWVTNFAEPILAAIKEREPDFQDDFSINTKRWYPHTYLGYDPAKSLVIAEGVMRVQDFGVSNYYFLNKPNIVLQVDILLPIAADHAAVNLSSNDFEVNPLKIQLNPNSVWSVRYNSIALFSGISKDDGQKTQIIVIVKDSRVAFYINGIPVAYYEYPGLLNDKNNERTFDCGNTSSDICYFDNVKFWNLNKIPNLP